ELAGAPDEVLVEPLELLDLVEEPVDQPLVELAEIDAFLAAFDPLALASEELGDLPREHVHVDRFLNVAVAAGDEGPLPVALHRVGGDGDHRGGREVGEGFEDGDDLVCRLLLEKKKTTSCALSRTAR